jgi:AraC-like DNA-binding protein
VVPGIGTIQGFCANSHPRASCALFQKVDASDACHRVGYLSPSQFSREYARFFGSAPTRDIARLREEGLAYRR